MNLLAQEMNKKDKALASTQTYLNGGGGHSWGKLILGSYLAKVIIAWNIFRKYQEGRKKVENGLREMCLENLALFKELAKSLEEIYFITYTSFEIYLKHVKNSIPLGQSLKSKFILTNILKRARWFLWWISHVSMN